MYVRIEKKAATSKPWWALKRHLMYLHLEFWISQPLELWKLMFCCLSYQVYAIFIIADWTETLMKNNLPSLLTNAVSSSVPLWNLSNAFFFFQIMINSCKILPPQNICITKKDLGWYRYRQRNNALTEPFWQEEEDCRGVFVEGGKGIPTLFKG